LLVTATLVVDSGFEFLGGLESMSSHETKEGDTEAEADSSSFSLMAVSPNDPLAPSRKLGARMVLPAPALPPLLLRDAERNVEQLVSTDVVVEKESLV
jgi:hypothetical protein